MLFLSASPNQADIYLVHGIRYLSLNISYNHFQSTLNCHLCLEKFYLNVFMMVKSRLVRKGGACAGVTSCDPQQLFTAVMASDRTGL